MKKIMLLCMATLIVVAMSCKKNEDAIADEEIPEGCFKAMLERPEPEDDKTWLDSTKVEWTKFDSIMVFNFKGEKAGFRLIKGERTGIGVFSKFTQDDFDMNSFPIVSVYPYDPDLELEGDTINGITIKNFHLPKNQIFTNNSFGRGANPMTAFSNNEELHFRNICGLLKIQLQGTKANIKSITVTDPTGMSLWGDGTLTLDHTTSIAKLNNLSNGSNSIKLYSENVVSLNFETVTNFYIVLPPDALQDGFVAEAKQGETDGVFITVMKKTATVSNKIQRNKIKRMPVVKNVVQILRSECVDLGDTENMFWCVTNFTASNSIERGSFISWGNLNPINAANYDKDEWQEKWPCFCQSDYIGSSGSNLSHSIVQGNIYDPAAMYGGAGWMIPTKSQYENLYTNCEWSFGNLSGRKGWFVSNEKNLASKIFIPCTGSVHDSIYYDNNSKGYYWSATIGSDTSKAVCLNFGNEHSSIRISEEPRYYGMTVRPICYYSDSY